MAQVHIVTRIDEFGGSRRWRLGGGSMGSSSVTLAGVARDEVLRVDLGVVPALVKKGLNNPILVQCEVIPGNTNKIQS